MKTLGKKLKNKKGFTLMEMLIVVAIIVVLVAVSIPVFTSQLDNAKEAADAANIRAAKSIALTEYMSDGTLAGKTLEGTTVTVYYDITDGKLVEDKTDLDDEDEGQSTEHKGKVITIIWTKSSGDIEVDFK